jgi:hypothetical protein
VTSASCSGLKTDAQHFTTPLVASAFADLKDGLDSRPIYRQTNDRVRAHLHRRDRAIEMKLKAQSRRH